MRANRYHIPGCIWHITHRCHKGEFLLKFRRDRRRWVQWLFEARKRYGLQVLNFIATSNHIHLLAVDGEAEETIPRSMQLIAGRVGQEYNQRKGRRGAFWEDRYHATAVGSEAFVTSVQARLGIRARFREITSESGMSVLREAPVSYGTVFEGRTGKR